MPRPVGDASGWVHPTVDDAVTENFVVSLETELLDRPVLATHAEAP